MTENTAPTHTLGEAFDALHDTVMELMVEFAALQNRVDAICDKLTEEFVDIRKRVDACDDKLAEEIVKLQERITKLETK